MVQYLSYFSAVFILFILFFFFNEHDILEQDELEYSPAIETGSLRFLLACF